MFVICSDLFSCVLVLVSCFFLHQNIIFWSFGLPVSYRYTSCMLTLPQTNTTDSILPSQNQWNLYFYNFASPTSKLCETYLTVFESLGFGQQHHRKDVWPNVPTIHAHNALQVEQFSFKKLTRSRTRFTVLRISCLNWIETERHNLEKTLKRNIPLHCTDKPAPDGAPAAGGTPAPTPWVIFGVWLHCFNKLGMF